MANEPEHTPADDEVSPEEFAGVIESFQADLRELGIKADTIRMHPHMAQKLWPRWHVCPRCQLMIAADDNPRIDWMRKWSWRLTHRRNCR